MIYLDHNATTRLHPVARQAIMPFLDEEWGNPSSIHGPGRRAREAVEQARAAIARLCGGRAEELVLTSGGTEADQLAVVGAARAMRARQADRTRILVSAIEHPAVAQAARGLERDGFSVAVVPVDERGRLRLSALDELVDATVALVSVQLANHELGNVLPVAEVARRAHAAGALVHTDAVQAAGKIPVDVGALGVDLLSLSAHKLYGPKGAGALWVRDGVTLAPVAGGGHQERGRRPGTENVAGVVGFGAAAARVMEEGAAWAQREAQLRNRLESGAIAVGARVSGDTDARVPNTTNLAWDGVEGELLVESLDLEGVACSTGAACTSGSLEPSPVLLALGQPNGRAREAVRFSLGRDTTEEEIDRVLALLPRLLARIRSA